MDPSSLPQNPAPQAPGVTPAAPVAETVTVVEPPSSQQPNSEARFTAADIERARQEEKDKLYGRLNKSDEKMTALEAELAKLREEREARDAQTQAEAAKVADEENQKRLAELSAKKLLEETRNDFEARFAAIQQERELERAALEKEAEFNRLRAYAQERVNAERENIAPELLDLISGNTQEEIDKSVEILKAKTTAILESVQQGQQQVRSQMRGVQPTGLTSLGPMDNDSGTRQLSVDDIKNMSMADFAKYRRQLIGEKAAQNDPTRSNTGVGLFG